MARATQHNTSLNTQIANPVSEAVCPLSAPQSRTPRCLLAAHATQHNTSPNTQIANSVSEASRPGRQTIKVSVRIAVVPTQAPSSS